MFDFMDVVLFPNVFFPQWQKQASILLCLLLNPVHLKACTLSHKLPNFKLRTTIFEG